MTVSSINEYGRTVFKNSDGLYHRTDGPAYISPLGYCAWYNNGVPHREDGPARISYKDGNMYSWIVNGIEYFNNKSFQKAAKLSDEDMIAIVLKYGNIE
jgi:hypothetical protein